MEPTSGSGGPPAVRVSLVTAGANPRRRRRVLGCLGVLVVLVGACIGSGLFAVRRFTPTLVPGERFSPSGKSAPENLVVVRADLDDEGVAEIFPTVLAALQDGVGSSGRAGEPDGVTKTLRDLNAQQGAQGVGFYLPVVATIAWDDVGVVVSASPAAVASYYGMATATSLTSVALPARSGVVVQFRGFASVLAGLFGTIVSTASQDETIEHGGARLGAGAPSPIDPDLRTVSSFTPRIVVANRLSLARDMLDAGLADPPRPLAPDDPLTLLDRLPATRDLYGLHRGKAAVRAIHDVLTLRAELVNVRDGKHAEDPPEKPRPPFPLPLAGLEATAWAIDVSAGDRARTVVALRYASEGEAEDARAALASADAAREELLADLNVPQGTHSIERAGRDVVFSTEGTGAAQALSKAVRERNRLEADRRESIRRTIQAAIDAAKKAAKETPKKPAQAPAKKSR